MKAQVKISKVKRFRLATDKWAQPSRRPQFDVPQPAAKSLKDNKWHRLAVKIAKRGRVRCTWAKDIAKAELFGVKSPKVELGGVGFVGGIDQCPACGKSLSWSAFFGFDWRATCPSCK